jgi:hypothetical protein
MEVKVMRNILRTFIPLAALASLGLMMGCDTNPSASPNPISGAVASIEVRVNNNTIRGFMGEERTMQVTAIARNSQNVVVPGAAVAFAIQGSQNWQGTVAFATESDTTDINGVVLGIYSVELQRSGNVTIEARTGNIVGTKTVALELLNEGIGSVTIEAPAAITVAPGQSKQVTITAAVQDMEGIGIQGVQVRFSTSPTALGTVDSDTGTTDFNGRVSKTFSTVADRYGFCQVKAQVGDSIDVATIQIVPVSQPKFIYLEVEKSIYNVIPNQSITIPITAVVTDENQVGVPGTKVEFTVEPFAAGGVTFGVVSIGDTIDYTGSSGSIGAIFRTLGGDGRVFIKARVLPSGSEEGEEISARFLLDIRRAAVSVGTMRVQANPDYLRIAPDSTATATISAVVKDQSGNALPNFIIDFQASSGRISFPTSTDSNGVATARFSISPAIDFEDISNVTEIATITATLNGTQITDETEITIERFSDAKGSLSLSTSTTVIYADNGATTATLRAVLKDADNAAMAGQEIVFSSFHGTVNTPVVTDSAGVALATFSDIGLPSLDEFGQIEPAIVFAKFPPQALEAFVEITIMPRSDIATINLVAQASVLTAGSYDSTAVVATVFQENGNRAPDGTPVNFFTNLGYFTADQVVVTGGGGRAETFYISGQLTGTANLVAYVANVGGDTAWSNVFPIVIRPGNPSAVRVTSDRPSLITNDPSQYANITALVTDTSGNAVDPGTLVSFTASLGTVTANAITDSSGRAVARLTTGVQSGFSDIVGTVAVPGGGTITGNTTVEFIAGNPNSIELGADPIEIQVAGTGGQESATLSATVRDPNGNLIGADVIVYFELIRQPAEPQGCNINQHGQIDSALTSNGIARATLNSGTQSGSVLIRAFTWRDPEVRANIVQVTISTVQVVAGPPESIDIDVNDSGTDVGGGSWVIEVSARVYDFYRNPVRDNIPVEFSCEPDIATITPANTGNPGRAGNPTKGLAYADMIYNSDNTLDTLVINSSVETPDGEITGSRPHTLPMQEGELQLNLSPINFMFDRNRAPNQECLIRCWGELRDGHGIRINNGPVLFTSNRAHFEWQDFRRNYNADFSPYAEGFKYTGWRPPKHQNYNEPDGVATVFLVGNMDDFFLDPFTLEVTVQIGASVVGYNDVAADPGFVFMTRH